MSLEPELVSLSNGIPVILQTTDSPVAALYWWVNAGSADEKSQEAGFAHFLEHMLFKDAAAKETGKGSTGQLARTIESLGGDINAYTTFDHTVYHVTCAAQHLERVIDAWGAMAAPQKFLKSDFEREREVILEELRKNEDSPSRQMFQKLFTAIYAKHPYGRPVIGFAKTLKKARVSELEAFYKKAYIPERMGLIVVGPLGDRRKRVLNLLEKRFGRKLLKPRPGVLAPRPSESPDRANPRFEVVTFDVKMPAFSIAFRVPEIEHEDIPALDLLGGILGMGELSRLYQTLFYDKSVVTDVSAAVYVPRDPGMLYFHADLERMDQIEPAARAMLEVIQKLAEEGPTQEELNRVLVHSESERMYATQTADGMAGRLGFMRFVLGDLGYDNKYLERLRAVDASKIKEVAKKYITFARAAGVVMVPKSESKWSIDSFRSLTHDMLGKISESAPSRATRGVVLKGARPATSTPEYFKLKSGIKVVHLERPTSQVFSIHSCVLGGLRLELARPMTTAQADWGASNLLASTWTKGTSKRDAKTLAAAVEGRAAGIDGFSGRNSAGVQMTGLQRDWKVLSELFTESLLDPAFPEEELEHSRRLAEDSLKSIEDHSGQLCSKLFLETLFQKHPYGKMTAGSLETVKKIQRSVLTRFHSAWVRPERLVVTVSGPVRREALNEWLASLESQALALAAKSKAVDLPTTVEPEPALKAPRIVEQALKREQLHILVGGLGTQVFAQDRYALRLMSNILGGQSGRLFIELREKKSLAYTVAPVSFEGIEQGYIGTYIACSPNKKNEALAGMRKVLEELASKGPSDKEMARAKEFYLGRRAMDLQSDSSQASHLGLEAMYGLPNRTDAERLELIQSVSASAIKDAVRRYLVEPHMVTAIVG